MVAVGAWWALQTLAQRPRARGMASVWANENLRASVLAGVHGPHGRAARARGGGLPRRGGGGGGGGGGRRRGR
jgi:hypothetical protein